MIFRRWCVCSFFFFSSRRRHTRWNCDWSSDVCSSDLLVLGAFGPRMLKIVARYGDTWNAFGTPQEMRERNQMLDDYCREIGRDPDTLDRSLYYWVPKSDEDPWVSKDAFYSVIEPYVEAGVNQFIFDQPRDDQMEMLEWAAAEALPRFAREMPRALEPASAAKIDTSDWKRPQDHL